MKTSLRPTALVAAALAATATLAAQPAAPAGQKQSDPPPPAAQSKAEPPPPPRTPAAAASAGRRPLLAQPEPSAISDNTRPGEIHVATKGLKTRTARALEGRSVRGSDKQTLGRVKDFLLDPHTGEVAYAVVSSGGIRRPDKLRLVPFPALRPDQEHENDFTVAMNEAEWDALGALDETEFDSGHITISNGQRRDLAQRFERAQTGAAASGSAYYTPAPSAELVRAGAIRGRGVFLAEKNVGTIDEIIVDPDAATASVLFDPSWRFTAAKERFVVPLNRYSFGTAKGERVMTTVTRADFDQLRTITDEAPPAETAAKSSVPPQPHAPAPAASGTTPQPKEETKLAPTGRTPPTAAPAKSAEPDKTTEQPAKSSEPAKSPAPAK